jgi:hypothetical protein
MKQLMQQKIVYDATSFINDTLDTSFMLSTSEASFFNKRVSREVYKTCCILQRDQQ